MGLHRPPPSNSSGCLQNERRHLPGLSKDKYGGRQPIKPRRTGRTQLTGSRHQTASIQEWAKPLIIAKPEYGMAVMQPTSQTRILKSSGPQSLPGPLVVTSNLAESPGDRGRIRSQIWGTRAPTAQTDPPLQGKGGPDPPDWQNGRRLQSKHRRAPPRWKLLPIHLAPDRRRTNQLPAR